MIHERILRRLMIYPQPLYERILEHNKQKESWPLEQNNFYSQAIDIFQI